MCAHSAAPDLCVAAPGGWKSSSWSLQLLVPAETQQALKSQAHNMHTEDSLQAQISTVTEKHNPQPLVQKFLSHTHTYTNTSLGARMRFTHAYSASSRQQVRGKPQSKSVMDNNWQSAGDE